MAVFHLRTPLSKETVRRLNIGDQVYLSGDVFTGRSRIHRHIFDEGNRLPFAVDRQNAMIHVGPIVIRQDDRWKLVSFMPTSSLRFEKWGALAVESWGLRMLVGKTTMGANTAQAMRRYGCVHVSPQCVSPNLWLESITVRDVALFDELGSIEAAWQLTLDDLGPFVVDMDAQGRNYFDKIDEHVRSVRPEVYKKLGIPEDFTPTKLY